MADAGIHAAGVCLRRLDLGLLSAGEIEKHFAVMAGAGFDAELVGGADRRAEARLGRLAAGSRQGLVPVLVALAVSGIAVVNHASNRKVVHTARAEAQVRVGCA